MKKIIILAILAMSVMTVQANVGNRVRYWYSQNVSSTVPPLSEIVTMQDNSDGQGVQFKWLIANPPTKATLQALDNATVEAWVKSTTKVVESETVYTTDQGLFLRAFIAELKKKNPALQMPTKAEVKAKFIKLKNN